MLTSLVLSGAKHPITQVAQTMLDLCDAKLKEVSVNVNSSPFSSKPPRFLKENAHNIQRSHFVLKI